MIMKQLSEIASKATPSKSDEKGKRRKGSKGLALTQLPIKKG